MPTRERRAKAVLRKALAALDEHYTLYYTSRGDDGLSEEQIAQLFAGEWQKVEGELDEWGQDATDYYVTQIIAEVITDKNERDLLADFPELELELRVAIEERDDSDGPLLEQLRVTSGKLMRYYLDYDLDPNSWSWSEQETENAMQGIAEAAGIDMEANRSALWSLVAESSYGGSLYVIWYDRPQEIVRAVLNHAWGVEHDVPSSISWTDPALVVLDSMNGSGMDDNIKGTVTKPFDPEKLAMDGQVRGYGYTWDQTASVVYGAYNNQPTLNR